MRKKFSNAFAQSAPPGVHKDESLPFWGLRVSPKGRRMWFLDCRIHGKRSYISLGLFPVVDAKEAKRRVLKAILQLENGEDPRKKRKSEEMNVEQATLAFEKEHFSHLKPSTLKDYKRHIRLFREAFSRKPVDSITSEDAEKFLSSYPSRVQANRMRSTIMCFYEWAIRKKLCEKNPFKEVRKAKEARRTELVSFAVLKKILEKFQERGMKNHYLFFLLIIRTGCRAGEALKMKKEDLTDGIWLKPAENTKNGKAQRVWIGEEICRYYFESIFKTPFPSIRPNWLLNEQGKRIEFDGYSEKFKIAFEHQGIQHYQKVEHFQDDNRFEKLKHHDALKRKICKREGIILFQIPQLYKLLTPEELPNWLNENFRKAGIEGYIARPLEINVDSIHRRDRIKQYRDVVEAKGGKLIADKFLSAHQKVRVVCKDGHEWETSFNSIKSDHWCPYCAGQKGNFLKILKDHCKARGGRCLDTTWRGNTFKYTFECSEKHQWKAVSSNVLPRKSSPKGSWCPRCHGNNEYSIEDIQKIAKKLGGKCLSNEYLGMNKKLDWECTEGHRWSATPSGAVHRGTWCPKCGRRKASKSKQKHSIESLDKEAQKRGGRCLSTEYVNTDSRLLWKCSCGHEWEGLVSNFLRGKWCPVCGRKKATLARRANKK